MEVTLNHYLILSAILFTIGLIGALTRRHIIIMLICLEIMLNAANLNLIAFWHFGLNPDPVARTPLCPFYHSHSRNRSCLGPGPGAGYLPSL